MTIKRDKDYLFKMIVTWVGMAFLAVLYRFGLQMPIQTFLLLHSPLFLYLLAFAVSYGRTFILDAEGCTVCFLWFRKHYCWDDLKTKRVERYPQFSLVKSGDCPYQKYVAYAPYQVHKPRWVKPLFYNILHPWSYIYFNFYISDPNTKGIFGPIIYRGRHYEIHEAEFLEKMRQWHVDLERLNNTGHNTD